MRSTLSRSAIRSEVGERLDPDGVAGLDVATVFLDDDQAVAGDHRADDARPLGAGRPDLPAAILVAEHAPLELPSAAPLRHRLARPRVESARRELAAPGELPEHGQDEEVGVADPAGCERAAGLPRDLPKVDRAELPQHLLDEVVGADRDPARRN